MFRKIQTPASFSLVQNGKVSLILRDEFKNLLLAQGIDNLKEFLKKTSQISHYYKGRKLHPCIPLENDKRIVLRQYSHGGLLRAITKNVYWFGARSFRELILTEQIRSVGIPTIPPVGAIHDCLTYPFYHAYFLSLEVPQATDLIQYLNNFGAHPHGENLFLKRKSIRSTGLLIRKFHQAGFYHSDLQLKNILAAGDQLLLIDFDRCYRKSSLSAREKIRNLLRLNRSVEKWKRLGLPISRTDRWRFFVAYAEDDKEIWAEMRRVLRTYSLRFIFYRFGWALEKIVGPRPRVRGSRVN